MFQFYIIFVIWAGSFNESYVETSDRRGLATPLTTLAVRGPCDLPATVYNMKTLPQRLSYMLDQARCI